MLIRHFRQYRLYKKHHLKLGFYSTIKNTELGENIFIGNSCSILNSKIGNNSFCNTNTNIINTIIGKFTSIGSNVSICVGAHPTNFVSTHPAFYANNKAFETFADKLYFDELSRIKIGNDVWIGSNSTILGNVTLGDGSIVAYGAVVTKNVLPYSIVGGIPAKFLKFRFGDEIVKRLLEIKWWELNESFLKDNFKLFLNPDEFIKYYDGNTTYIEQFRQNK